MTICLPTNQKLRQDNWFKCCIALQKF